jgi:nucleoside-diphosphate-sugar epimerase
MEEEKHPVVAITGGAGFVGRFVVRELLAPRKKEVLRAREIRVLDLRPAHFSDERIRSYRGDIRDSEDLGRVFRGADVVFHLAALIDWGQHPRAMVRQVNVEGTRKVIQACREEKVKALVFCSSLDAVYGGLSIQQGDESLPYPDNFPTAYCESKADAERLVVEANDDGLRTLVIRPCAIWGEGDPYHIEPLLKMARLGPVLRLGRSPAPTQMVYVGNVAHALLLGAKALLENRPEADGQVFFATDFPAKNFFDHLEPFVRAAGGRVVPPVFALPRGPMRFFAVALTFIARCLRPIYAFTPLFTPFSVDYVCQEFTIKSDKAYRLLDYQPLYTEAEALERTISAIAPGRV